MLIYVHVITERCIYVMDLIFRDLLGTAYSLTDDLSYYQIYDHEKLAYTFQNPGSGFFIESVTLLYEHSIREVDIDVFPFAGTQAFFRSQSGRFPFDPFAASFYLVSRYEEYLPFEADRFGRFQAKNSLAYKHRFLETPVINYWVMELKKSLLDFYPALSFQNRMFKSVTSFDIDVAYAFLGRPVLYSIAALLKDLALTKTGNVMKRLKVITRKEADPYDTYGTLQNMLHQYDTETIFFFLLRSTPTRYDRNLSPSSPTLRRLIKRISSFSCTGIHPSYYTIDKPRLLHREKERLEEINNQPVTKSRQHYLRFLLPGTYTQLLQSGITDDYSMGYAETPGFRAGICTPFFFFDLTKNKATSLTIHPIAYMDGSFIEDLNMQPEASIETIRRLVSTVKEVQGTFLCIWHNHTVSEYGVYKGWKRVLDQTLQMVQAK